MVARYLEPWIQRGELRCSNAKTLVLTLIAIVLSRGPLRRVFLGDAENLNSFSRRIRNFASHDMRNLNCGFARDFEKSSFDLDSRSHRKGALQVMDLKGKAAVVCGGGGFIGGHLVKSLLANGVNVIRAVDIKPMEEWYQSTAESRTSSRI